MKLFKNSLKLLKVYAKIGLNSKETDMRFKQTQGEKNN